MGYIVKFTEMLKILQNSEETFEYYNYTMPDGAGRGYGESPHPG